MFQAGPRWCPNHEIAWHIERLLLHVRYTNRKHSPSSKRNTIKFRVGETTSIHHVGKLTLVQARQLAGEMTSF